VADESVHGARALTAAGALTARGDNAETGRALLERGIDAWSALDNREELAAALDVLGWLLIYDAGDDQASLQAFERSLELRRQLGDAAGETRALVGVCQVLVALGEVERAEVLSLELLERSADDPRTEHFAYHFLADCALIRGDTGEAETRYRQSLHAALPLGDVIETSFEVQGVAMAAAGNGDPARALRLAGAVAALWESLGTSFSIAFWDSLLERYIGAAKSELAEEADAVWADGRGLPFDDAVELALKLE
jgi:tetratricopeptide (TPR) repeat protein